MAAPTQDRIMLGLVAGAAVGGVLLAFSPTGGGGALIGLFAAFVLALLLAPVVINLILWRELPASEDLTAISTIYLGVGAVVGLVVWRASRWNVDVTLNGG